MKPSLPLVLVVMLAFAASSCQKLIDKKKEQIAMEFITTHDWYVEQYLDGEVDVTSEFTNYVFHFNTDYSVTGVRANEVHTGTWQPEITTISIISQFATAPAPISKLNGTWKLKDSSTEFVKAEMPGTNGKKVLRLRKKE
ncbi:hypothetical protein [Paraflavitalea pollutisoli]|uniref:hypothetical protein n=1 Tax=Paraflavitalea pollutisoli TaxID=3034143 RepID=UPI0023EB4784|nr:hypothetical protein [Paraflavitalea sp. H1-2-19X]